MFRIGEFSKISGLPVKTLRFYHEKGLLVPAHVGSDSGYRYYDARDVERARVIVALRSLDFPLAEIATILAECDDDADVLDELRRRKDAVAARLEHLRNVEHRLETILARENEARQLMQRSEHEVVEKSLEPTTVASVRYRGRYDACGAAFSKIFRAYGRYAKGKPFCLYYDGEYKEDDADIEVCVPIRAAGKSKSVDGITVRDLPGERCLTLLHRGPYADLGPTYAKAFARLRELGHEVSLPTREVYIKGPGMIFKGRPKRYLTEVCLPIAST